MMFKILSTDALGISGRQSEINELALSFGFHGIDIDMSDFAEQVDLYGLSHARRLIDSACIRIGMFRLPIVWGEWEEEETSYQRGLEKLPKIAELASGLGCTRCVTTVRPACDERPYHENFEFHRLRLAEIAEILEPRGITLGIDFLAPAHLRKGRAFQFIHSLDALVLLAKGVAANNVGLAIDLWHLHVSGSSLEELKDFPTDRIVAVFLSDIPESADPEVVDESERQMPGESGGIDSVAALTTLAEIGFDGPVSVRASRRALEGMQRDAIVRLAGDRIGQIWKAAGLDFKGNLSATSTG